VAKYRFRGALNAAVFPLLSFLQGRTVVQPQLDNNVRTTQAFYGTEESADYSIPQLLFCENIVPTAEGIQSVGYTAAIEGIPEATSFDQVITLRDADENVFLFCPAGGANYIYAANSGSWVSTNPITAPNVAVSRAYVNGRTFVCYEGLGIYEYDSTLNTFTSQPLVGLSSVDIRGIGASNNYLLAFTDITQHWSSLINPLDFTPSLLTGAGFAIPQDVKGKITAVSGTAGGFIIHTTKNAVAAVYTNNVRAPFTFKEISNAGGTVSYEQVTGEQTAGSQYAWTTGGFQRLTLQTSEHVSAEVNDFLAGRVWESWDSATKSIVSHNVGAPEFQIKIAHVSTRYIVLSYSVDNSGVYQYALIYDVILKRWGKLRITHTDCFTFPYPNVYGDLSYTELASVDYYGLSLTSYEDLATGVISNTPSKRSMAFLAADGTVSIALMDYNKDTTDDAVAVFGKFQLLRARMITSQQLSVEGFYSAEGTTIPPTPPTVVASIDGKNSYLKLPMVHLTSGPFSASYAKRVTGLNLSYIFEGSMALSSYVLEVTAEGDR
jgi:hypothetical protein